MNDRDVINILRISDQPLQLYAADRLEAMLKALEEINALPAGADERQLMEIRFRAINASYKALTPNPNQATRTDEKK